MWIFNHILDINMLLKKFKILINLQKKLLNTNFYIAIVIFFFSFFINKYYANLGVFPIDTFLHYDSGYRILNNQYPTKDFWITTGIFIDFLQSLFFKILGVSWSTYVFHSSFINGIISTTFYFVLISLDLNRYYSSIYALCFSFLAYTISGTPFVDHHAAFFLLLGIFSFILAIVKTNIFYWIIAPWFLGFSLLTKQVPAAYLLIFLLIIFAIYFYLRKNINILKYIFISILFFIIFCLIIIKIFDLNLTNIYLQYFLYPQTIGEDRLINIKNLKLIKFINNFKFILAPLLILLITNIIYGYKKKNFFKSDFFFIFLLIFFYTSTLLFHQILTKNQIFIFFLSPLLFAFLNILLKNKKKINIFFLIISILITLKIHFEFNEKRKFHDLRNVNLNNYLSASLINDSLKGLNWVTDKYKDNSSLEIKKLNNVIKYISIEKNPKMLITNYLFISSVLNQNLFSPSKAYTEDGTTYPLKANKYYKKYKEFFINIINSNNIKFIYLIKAEGIKETVVTDYLNSDCFIKREKNYLIIFEILKKCS